MMRLVERAIVEKVNEKRGLTYLGLSRVKVSETQRACLFDKIKNLR